MMNTMEPTLGSPSRFLPSPPLLLVPAVPIEHVNLPNKYFSRIAQRFPPLSLVRLIEFGACLYHQDRSS